jgi:hypothetical protein
MGALTGADLPEQRHRAFLEQAGADAAKYVFRCLTFENHVIDAVMVQ